MLVGIKKMTLWNAVIHQKEIILNLLVVDNSLTSTRRTARKASRETDSLGTAVRLSTARHRTGRAQSSGQAPRCLSSAVKNRAAAGIVAQ